jgi:TRAP-type C4-dicarboxylate transport system substrate-binding protein
MKSSARGAAALAVAVLAISSSFSATAQDVEPFRLNVLGTIGTIPQTTEVERPGFTGIPAKTGGKVDVRYRSFQDLGLKGDEMLRLVSRGDFDIGSLIAGYISGDSPFFMGVDVPGLAPTLEAAKAQTDAFRGVLDAHMGEKFNLKVVAVFPSPLQVLYCREPISSLAELKGKRIRVHATALSTLVQQLGGTAVSIAFAEVYTSLQRGVADCAATSTAGGNNAKLFEVTKQMVVLPLGWAMSAFVANKTYWDGLKPGQRALLEGELKQMDQKLWDIARDRGEDALNCNMGKDCKYGTNKGASMTVYWPTADELKAVRDIVGKSVLVDWAKECSSSYAPCVEKWNETVGKVAGVTATK